MGSWGADGAFAEGWANAQHAFGSFITTVQEHWIVTAIVVLLVVGLWRWTTSSSR